MASHNGSLRVSNIKKYLFMEHCGIIYVRLFTLAYWVFWRAFLSSAKFIKTYLSGIQSVWQIIWIKTKPTNLWHYLGPNCLQLGYQQTIKVAISMLRVNNNNYPAAVSDFLFMANKLSSNHTSYLYFEYICYTGPQ